MYVSPYVEINKEKSIIEFKISGLNIDGYAVIEEDKVQIVAKSKFTSDQCATFRNEFVERPKKLLQVASSRKVQLVLLTSSSVYVPNIQFTFEQRNPPKYSSLIDNYHGDEFTDDKPEMKTIEGNVNRCSFEFNSQGTLDCDWLLLKSRDNKQDGSFELSQAAPCVKRGLQSLPTGEKRFIMLKGTREQNNLTLTAFAVSPIIRPSHRRVEVSIFTTMTCYHGHVRVYFVPSTETLLDDVKFVTSQYKAVMEVKKMSHFWEQSQVTLEDIEPNKDYQVNDILEY